jgi:hypothetical protein
MRQRRWIELIKDYELEVHYHPGKANVVVDALSHKAHYNYLSAVRLTGEESSTRVLPDLSLFNIILTPTLKDEIITAQKNDEGMSHIRRTMQEGDPKVAYFHKDAEGTLWFKERLVVPKKGALQKKILDEAHMSRYSIHPGSTKMYQDLRQQFWWTRTKRQTARYVSKCDTCQKVKADYIKPGGLLQPLSILDWKWDDISMDFIVGLPLTARKFDSIWVIMDRLSKSAHFVPIRTRYDARRYVEIYITCVLCIHRVLKTIISDRGSLYPRKLESREVMPRDLCKQEVSTIGVRGRRSCILEGLVDEGCKEIWGERKVRVSLHRTFPILEKCGTVAFKLNLPPS